MLTVKKTLILLLLHDEFAFLFTTNIYISIVARVIELRANLSLGYPMGRKTV